MLLSTGQTSNNRVVLRKHAADEAEERRLAGLQPGDRRQPGTGGPDERQPDLLQRVAQPVGRPRVVADELRPSLGADALRAGRDPADEPAHPHPEPDRRAASREVGDGAFVATVDAMCATLAGGTACGPAGDEEPEGDPFLGDGDLGETQPFEMGQERRKAHATTPRPRRQQPNRTAQGLRRKAARSDHRKSARPNPLWCLSATEEYS